MNHKAARCLHIPTLFSALMFLCVASYGQGRDFSFLYDGDLHHFVKDEPAAVLYIVGGTLIDGSGSAPRLNPGIVVRHGKLDLTPGAQPPAGAQKVDAAGRWILPGLFDVHAHVTYFVPTGWNVEDDVMNAVRALRLMDNYQKIGVTTIADVGSRHNVAYSLKHAQRMGLVDGARMFVSGPVITTPGGHATEFIPLEKPVYAIVATGPWEFRNRVREAVNLGADFVKLTPPYSDEELRATVDEAKEWKIRVTAHIGGLPDPHMTSARRLVDAGVQSVHHLYPYGPQSQQIARDLVKKGIYVVPTIGYHLRELQGKAHVRGNWMEDNLGHTLENMLSLFKTLNAAGVKFALGTDSNAEDILTIGKIYLGELEGLATGGLSPMQIIQTATLHAAQSLGVDHDSGSIETGKRADLILLEKNPLEDLKTLVAPTAVIQDGRFVYRR